MTSAIMKTLGALWYVLGIARKYVVLIYCMTLLGVVYAAIITF